MKVAVLHYWFITRRGGEKVVESILKLYPQADVYTLFYDEKKYGSFLKNHNVYTSKYNTPFFRKHYQKIFPLYPRIVNSLELKKEYDLIISSESGPIKGIRINNKATHVCYIHSPMRYCWGYTNEYLRSINSLFRPIANFFFNQLRKWDYSTKDNVDLYIANSKNVAKRVKKYYDKESIVIYPPIDNKLFEKPLVKQNKKDYFLSFGAITPYKRIDLLVETFNRSGENLVIIGDGSEKEKLEQKAKSNIIFKGFLNEEELSYFIQNSRALLFPGEEDFGMIPLEVMSYGIPVIAFAKGGALETVIENRNKINESSGVFFDQQNVQTISEAVIFFKTVETLFDPLWIRRHAQKFAETIFLYRFRAAIKKNNIS